MHRIALAMVVAAVAASVAYAITIGTAMKVPASVVPSLWILLIPGLLWGMVFAIAVLMPLHLLMRQTKHLRRLLFGVAALAVWVLVSAVLFATRDLSSKEVLGNVLMALPCGIAAVLGFVAVVRAGSDA